MVSTLLTLALLALTVALVLVTWPAAETKARALGEAPNPKQAREPALGGADRAYKGPCANHNPSHRLAPGRWSYGSTGPG